MVEAMRGVEKRRGATLPAAVQNSTVLVAVTDNERTLPCTRFRDERSSSVGFSAPPNGGGFTHKSWVADDLRFLSRISALE
jgi:hypothetical protein